MNSRTILDPIDGKSKAIVSLILGENVLQLVAAMRSSSAWVALAAPTIETSVLVTGLIAETLM